MSETLCLLSAERPRESTTAKQIMFTQIYMLYFTNPFCEITDVKKKRGSHPFVSVPSNFLLSPVLTFLRLYFAALPRRRLSSNLPEFSWREDAEA